MKLRNKKTGEIAEFAVHKKIGDSEDGSQVYAPYAIDPEEWEGYEEPKKYYVINPVDWKEIIGEIEYRNDSTDKINKEIGNYFETKEEAEKAVEKLKAWKRLKDNGFKFTAYQLQELNIKFFLDHGYTKMGDDLDLLFGGEK